MKVGQKYRVTFDRGYRRTGSFVGKYLGKTAWGELQFDLRPEGGTTTVPKGSLIKAEEV